MESEQELVLLDLAQARGFFKCYIDQQSFSESLTSKILSFYDDSLAKSIVPTAQHSSTTSGDNESKNNRPKSMIKKRKTMQKSSSQKMIEVKVGTGDSVHELLRDAYSWRKYGQKSIQHAYYPRAYFRCTHKYTKGCTAMKQIQQSGENPPVFKVTYIRTHTCNQRPQLKENNLDDDHVQQQWQQPDLMASFQNSLTVKTEVSGSNMASPSFSFPPTPVNCLDHSASGNCVTCNFSSSLVSPATSGTDFFSVSSCRVDNYGEGSSKQPEECSFEEMMSVLNEADISPFISVDDMLAQSYFDDFLL